MAGKAEIIVGVLNDGVTVGAGAAAVADQFIVNSDGMVLLNQSAQAGAVVASVTSVTKLAGPYVPIISMPANIVAGTITFLKIGIDVREGEGISDGDVVSLVGNVAGVIGTMTVLAGASAGLVGFFTLVSVSAGLYSIRESQSVDKIIKSARDFFVNNPSDNYLDYVCAPDMRIVDRNTIRMAYANMMLSCNWKSDAGELLPSSVVVPDEPDKRGGGGGGSGFIRGTYSPPGPTIPSPAPPPHDVANVGISIIVAGKTYDAGDQYGCCTGTSDGYM
ncbi:hypothetical protein [Pseudomonas fragi]|uniref:Uncharacterized protein n=1 Tax=Pseudomonas fragi TaxID=296 RepID=A0A449II66_PSEFR|nr:hypothetical protein [Pseudomonas fragi]VFB19217.1 Uncharacterised protein [Pseudomonas fragi]